MWNIIESLITVAYVCFVVLAISAVWFVHAHNDCICAITHLLHQ
jgi:hypothetical protein